MHTPKPHVVEPVGKLDARRCVISLRSTTCPACGGPKGRGKSLCSGQYFELPAHMRTDQYRRIGSDYEEAMAESLLFLGVTTFIDPPSDGK